MDFYQSAMNHKSIRFFKNEKIEKEILCKIVDGMLRTASSNGMQQASCINVENEEKKKQISKVCGQDYVAKAPHLFIFIVDNYRNRMIYEEKGENEKIKSDIDIFFQGFTDACLMAEKANSLAESFGLGTLYLGSILRDTDKIISILELPKLTFPVLGLLFGKPEIEPELKPRIKKEYRFFENTYKKEDSYIKSLKSYDEEISKYVDVRNKDKKLDPFTDQVVSKLKMCKKSSFIKSIIKNGYNFD